MDEDFQFKAFLDESLIMQSKKQLVDWHVLAKKDHRIRQLSYSIMSLYIWVVSERVIVV
jgi:hypothetical protein